MVCDYLRRDKQVGNNYVPSLERFGEYRLVTTRTIQSDDLPFRESEAIFGHVGLVGYK